MNRIVDESLCRNFDPHKLTAENIEMLKKSKVTLQASFTIRHIYLGLHEIPLDKDYYLYFEKNTGRWTTVRLKLPLTVYGTVEELSYDAHLFSRIRFSHRNGVLEFVLEMSSGEIHRFRTGTEAFGEARALHEEQGINPPNYFRIECEEDLFWFWIDGKPSAPLPLSENWDMFRDIFSEHIKKHYRDYETEPHCAPLSIAPRNLTFELHHEAIQDGEDNQVRGRRVRGRQQRVQRRRAGAEEDEDEDEDEKKKGQKIRRRRGRGVRQQRLSRENAIETQRRREINTERQGGDKEGEESDQDFSTLSFEEKLKRLWGPSGLPPLPNHESLSESEEDEEGSPAPKRNCFMDEETLRAALGMPTTREEVIIPVSAGYSLAEEEVLDVSNDLDRAIGREDEGLQLADDAEAHQEAPAPASSVPSTAPEAQVPHKPRIRTCEAQTLVRTDDGECQTECYTACKEAQTFVEKMDKETQTDAHTSTHGAQTEAQPVSSRDVQTESNTMEQGTQATD